MRKGTRERPGEGAEQAGESLGALSNLKLGGEKGFRARKGAEA